MMTRTRFRTGTQPHKEPYPSVTLLDTTTPPTTPLTPHPTSCTPAISTIGCQLRRPTLMAWLPLVLALSLSGGVALFPTRVAAYTASDVCSVVISVSYTKPKVLTETLTLSKSSSKISTALAPGTFTIGVGARLCDSPNTVAFEGSSSEQVISGTETTAKTISVVAVDKEALSNVDASTKFPPLITSIEVDKPLLKYDQLATLKCTGRAFPSGAPSKYTLTMAGVDGAFPDGKVCGSGGASCALQYKALSPAMGNIKFSFQAEMTDGTASTNDPSGYVLVDPKGDISVSVVTRHRPSLETPSTVAPSSSVLIVGDTNTNSLKLDFGVKDTDFTTSDGDEVTVNVVTEKVSFFGGTTNLLEQQCGSASASVLTAANSQGAAVYRMTWTPPVLGQTIDASKYGETVCRFTMTATDKYGLKSQTLVYTAAVRGTAAAIGTGASFGQRPELVSFLVSTEVTIGGEFAMGFTYIDADSKVKWSATITYTSELKTTKEDLALKDCTDPNTPCSASSVFTVPTNAPAGTASLTLTLTDESLQTTVKTVQIAVQSAGKRRRRRREAATSTSLLGTMATNFRYSDGTFSAELPAAMAAEMGSLTTTTSTKDGTSGEEGGSSDDATNINDDSVPGGDNNDNNNNNNNSMSILETSIISGAVGGVVLVALLAVVIVSRQRSRAYATSTASVGGSGYNSMRIGSVVTPPPGLTGVACPTSSTYTSSTYTTGGPRSTRRSTWQEVWNLDQNDLGFEEPAPMTEVWTARCEGPTDVLAN